MGNEAQERLDRAVGRTADHVDVVDVLGRAPQPVHRHREPVEPRALRAPGALDGVELGHQPRRELARRHHLDAPAAALDAVHRLADLAHGASLEREERRHGDRLDADLQRAQPQAPVAREVREARAGQHDVPAAALGERQEVGDDRRGGALRPDGIAGDDRGLAQRPEREHAAAREEEGLVGAQHERRERVVPVRVDDRRRAGVRRRVVAVLGPRRRQLRPHDGDPRDERDDDEHADRAQPVGAELAGIGLAAERRERPPRGEAQADVVTGDQQRAQADPERGGQRPEQRQPGDQPAGGASAAVRRAQRRAERQRDHEPQPGLLVVQALGRVDGGEHAHRGDGDRAGPPAPAPQAARQDEQHDAADDAEGVGDRLRAVGHDALQRAFAPGIVRRQRRGERQHRERGDGEGPSDAPRRTGRHRQLEGLAR